MLVGSLEAAASSAFGGSFAAQSERRGATARSEGDRSARREAVGKNRVALSRVIVATASSACGLRARGSSVSAEEGIDARRLGVRGVAAVAAASGAGAGLSVAAAAVVATRVSVVCASAGVASSRSAVAPSPGTWQLGFGSQ